MCNNYKTQQPYKEVDLTYLPSSEDPFSSGERENYVNLIISAVAYPVDDSLLLLLPVKAKSFSGLMMKMMHDEDELTKAAATGNTCHVQFLLSNGVNVNGVNKFGRTPIQVVMMGNTPLAHLLLEYGADPNVPDPRTGSTPLHDAARTGFIDTVRLLFRFNADPNATDYSNLRPLDVARQAGHVDVVKFLSSI